MADYLSPTPYANPLTGLSNDMIQGLLGYMKDKQRTQQMQGMAGLLESTGIPQTVERAAYADSPKALLDALTNVNRANVPLLKAETADALMNVAPFVGPAAKGAERAAMAAGRAGERYAEKVVPQIMERGGLPAQLLGDLSYGSVSRVIPASKIDELTGLPLNSDGTVTLFHHTNKDAAEQIAKTGRLKSAGEPSVYLTTQKVTDTGYGDVAVPVRVKPSLLNLDDEFPSGRMDFSIDTGKPKGSIPVEVEKQSFSYPQEEALKLAQQRAALPVEQGGLGLLSSNTPAERAAAMSGKEAIHFSRTGGDFNVLDSGQYAVAPFDAVGTHVGTKEAALERFKNTSGTIDTPKGSTYPVQVLGDRPLMNPEGLPWSEDELNAFLRQSGEYNSSNAKMTYQDMNKELRKKLFEEQGYTSIPYVNDVEAKGIVSYIVPPENLRSRFAAFDPWRRTSAIASAMGVAAPDLLAEEQNPKKKQNLLD